MSLPDIDFAASTALVTGGSSGIGLAIAKELVKRGVRQLVITGTDETKLDKVASEIKSSASDLKLHTLSIDLSSHDGPSNLYKQVQEWGLSIDLLVNNAGFARKYIFAEDPASDSSLKTVDLMVRAPVDLALLCLPSMVKAGRGGVLNVGSTAAYQPVPYTALYAASKAFILSWSQAIRQEQISAKTGVRFACVVPGITETNLAGDGHGEKRGPIDNVGIDQPEDVAKVAVDVLEANDATRIVGWNNKIFQGAMGLLPTSTVAGIVASARGPPGEGSKTE